MKRLFLLLIMVSIVVFGFLSGADAYPYTGEYMFANSGNDPFGGSEADRDALEGYIEDWFLSKGITRDIELDPYDKVDAPDTTSIAMTVTYDSSNLFGTWSTGSVEIEFYIVKGANEYAMYWINGGASYGDWTAEHLLTNNGNIPQVSHLSTWNPLDPNDPPPGADPVPEPATMILLGTGLIGLAGASRKKFMK